MNLSTNGFFLSRGPQTENENEHIYKFMDLTGELKNLSKIKMTVIPIVIDALRKIRKSLEKNISVFGNERRAEVPQTTALSRLVRIFRKVLQTKGNMLAQILMK